MRNDVIFTFNFKAVMRSQSGLNLAVKVEKGVKSFVTLNWHIEENVESSVTVQS